MIEIINAESKPAMIEKRTILPWSQYKNGKNFTNGPKNFQTETTTVWSFSDRGDWATHTPQYRGNWSPRVVRNLLMLYSKPGDTVLDPMVGGGTTPVECKLLKRNSISIDINPESINITRNRLSFDCDSNDCFHKTFVGDARNMVEIDDDSIDVVLTHPPYANMIKYSDNVQGDLSRIDNYDVFFEEYQKIINESYRVLKPNGYCAVLIGDTHKKSHYVPLSIKMLILYLQTGFVLKEEIIKKEWNCNSSFKYNQYPKTFLLTAHEHLFVFRKLTNAENLHYSSIDFLKE